MKNKKAKKASPLVRFHKWRIRHLSDKNFILILSILVGFSAGIAAVLIKNSVHFIQSLLLLEQTKDYHSYLYFVSPAIGIFAVLLFIKYIVKQPIGHGIPSVLWSISKNNGKIKLHNCFSSIVSSALTVGFGGSVGLEGPTVATGAALGSNIGRIFHLNYKQIVLLLGCACTGAMAAIFKAPVAAIVFALEVIMLDLTMASLIPLLFASVSAVLTSYLFLGQDVLYPFTVEESFVMKDLPFYIILGVICGLFSSYFTRVYVAIGKFFDRFALKRYRFLIGASVLGLLLVAFPPLYGEGYEVINSALAGDVSFLFENNIFSFVDDSTLSIIVLLISIVLFKVVATSLTFGSGGIGGIFAPTLFMGANIGLVFAIIINQSGFYEISQSNFSLIAMAGMISGVLHAPLTGIFLIGDISGGYALFLPIMITSAVSYATVRIFEKNSVYTIQLAKRKELITHHKDKAILSRMNVMDLLETNFCTISKDKNLGDFVKVVPESKRNIFPVVDENNNLEGVIFINDLRNIIFKRELYEKTMVHELMFWPSPIVSPDESMEDVAQKFHNSSHYNLPVLDKGKYLGFVSRARVFSAYRKMVKEFSEE